MPPPFKMFLLTLLLVSSNFTLSQDESQIRSLETALDFKVFQTQNTNLSAQEALISAGLFKSPDSLKQKKHTLTIVIGFNWTLDI